MDTNNSIFWNELCGSSMAKHLGINDFSQESLKKFDDYYFNFYPYLNKYINFDKLSKKNVLEIGLGYGSVSQKIAEAGAYYTGLDISPGPVNMVRHRFEQIKYNGHVLEGSILSPHLEKNQFDYIFAIGCLHHTGNLKLAIDNCYSMLKDGGTFVFMVYYAYSYRRLFQHPLSSLKYLLFEMRGGTGSIGLDSSSERATYDANSKGCAAPITDVVSKKSILRMCQEFRDINMELENITRDFPFLIFSRDFLMKTPISRIAGLDVYVTAIK